LKNDINLSFQTLRKCYANGALARDIISRAVGLILEAPNTNAWIHLEPLDRLMEQCEAVERRRLQGHALPLFGVPFGVKDNIDVAGMPTTAACPDFTYKPDRSARTVQMLVDAGAICLGKTNLDQFATGLCGVRSPYGACASIANPLYVSGGVEFGVGCRRRSEPRLFFTWNRYRRLGKDSGRLQRHCGNQAHRRAGLDARTGTQLPVHRLRIDICR
jgi:allophanate hydrolase